MQCQPYSCDPSRRGSGLPAHPGTSSLVRRGARRGSKSRNLTMVTETLLWMSQTDKGMIYTLRNERADL